MKDCNEADSSFILHPSSLRVRMALHTGDVQFADGAYHGQALHRASRILSAGSGGQILVSEVTAGLLRSERETQVQLVDLGVWRLRDVPLPERLHQANYAGMPAQDFGALSAEAGYQSHLPLQFTRFFGREKELARLQELLAPHASETASNERLVTLTGPGGTGKSRLAVEAAGSRLGWEHSRVVTLTAVLDTNSRGTEGFEWGPGIDAGIPLFNPNQGGITRAQAELQRASSLYLAARQRVATEVRIALVQYQQAAVAAAEWRGSVLVPLEEQVAVAGRAFTEGEVAYLFVIEMNRRLTDARLRAREADADMARAQAKLERAGGRRCGMTEGERPSGF
jgi:hypothetical protein